MMMELAILDYIQEFMRCSFLDMLMPAVTALGNYAILWIALSALLLCFPKTRRIGIVMSVSLIIEIVLCNVILKPAAARVRPFDVNTGIQLLIRAPKDFSFPSGHTGASFAAAAALFFAGSRAWIPAGALAVLIGFSRLYLYVHYPTDVLGGALLGIATGWLACRLTGWKAKG